MPVCRGGCTPSTWRLGKEQLQWGELYDRWVSTPTVHAPLFLPYESRMPAATIAALVAHELSLPEAPVARALQLLEGGATVPFIARYRKEATSGLDDGALQRLSDHAKIVEAREARREHILETVRAQGALTPELEHRVRSAATLAELEDLYLPFKPRRRTRAQAAREKGLQPLAEQLLAQAPQAASREELARPYGLPADEAWAGARDIAAELIAERADLRAEVRRVFETVGELTVDVARGKSKAPELERYRDHVGLRERASRAPSHRVLAAERGEAEGVLKVSVEVPRDHVMLDLRRRVLSPRAAPLFARELSLALDEALDRLLLPSLESEARRGLKQSADEEAIRVFARNLEALLLAPPLGPHPVLAIDPGLRTGCKVVALDERVKLDPQGIGVGQYQHDVDQAGLARALDRVVESVVNRVGVDLNTASPALLQHIAGLGPALAKAIVAHRAAHGAFPTRAALREVPRLGAKAFEQCAGFLRIRDGREPLDASAVHPERYAVVTRMGKDLGVERGALVGNAALAARVDAARYVDEAAGVGLPTLRDILAELEKPGRDPRAEFSSVAFDPGVTELAHVKPGMIMNGVVTNVAEFGASVDVGVQP